MAERKVTLRLRCAELIEMSKTVQVDKTEIDEDSGWFSQKKTKQKAETGFRNLKKKIFDLEEAVHLFDLEQKMSINPFLAWIYLILGVFFGLLSFILLLHM